MSSLATLAQALGISYASGVSLYATVALVGLLGRTGHIGPLPGALGAVTHWAVIGVAGALFIFEFLATLVPGIASLWETFHTAVRPPRRRCSPSSPPGTATRRSSPWPASSAAASRSPRTARSSASATRSTARPSR